MKRSIALMHMKRRKKWHGCQLSMVPAEPCRQPQWNLWQYTTGPFKSYPKAFQNPEPPRIRCRDPHGVLLCIVAPYLECSGILRCLAPGRCLRIQRCSLPHLQPEYPQCRVTFKYLHTGRTVNDVIVLHICIMLALCISLFRYVAASIHRKPHHWLSCLYVDV